MVNKYDIMMWRISKSRTKRGGERKKCFRFISDICEIYRASSKDSIRFLPVWLSMNGNLYIANGNEKYPIPVTASSADPKYPDLNYCNMLKEKGLYTKVGEGADYADYQMVEMVAEIEEIGINEFIKRYCKPAEILKRENKTDSKYRIGRKLWVNTWKKRWNSIRMGNIRRAKQRAAHKEEGETHKEEGKVIAR